MLKHHHRPYAIIWLNVTLLINFSFPLNLFLSRPTSLFLTTSQIATVSCLLFEMRWKQIYPKQRLSYKPDSAICVFVNTTMIKSTNFLWHPFLLHHCWIPKFFFLLLLSFYRHLEVLLMKYRNIYSWPQIA